MPNINVPTEAQEGLDGSMDSSDAVQLPFQVAHFFVRNGNKNFKQQGGVGYCGGFQVDNESLEKIFDTPPEGLDLQTYDGNNGAYNVYETRSIMIAPITKRYRFFENRTHLQILAMLALPSKNGLINLGPQVLSSKGYQTRYVQAALTDFAKATKEWRTANVNGADSKFFWATLTTAGDDVPEFVPVGKNVTSNITPIVLSIPSALAPEYLEDRYVGDAVATEMAAFNAQSEEWREDWSKKKEEVVVELADEDVPF